MEELFLRKPTLRDEKAVMEYRDEFLSSSSDIRGTKHLEDYEDYKKWFEDLDKQLNGEPPISQYLMIRKSDNRLISMTIIRHTLNDTNKDTGGHIGVGVRPSERGKGYGSTLLQLALDKCKELGIKNVLMSCRKDNTSSLKNIRKHGGVYESEIVSKKGNLCERYWINLDNGGEMKVDTNFFKVLKERGLLYQCTDEEALKKMLESGKPIALYEGTDPTADSLHIGHCVPYVIMRRFQQAGHKVYLLMGGATACIGDPTGRSEIRKIMSKEQIQSNIDNIKETLKVFLDFDGENKAEIVNNYDWFKDLSYIDFMRDIGQYFNVNEMLSSEIYDNRLKEGGLTFFEMGYMPMQAYDFVHLNKEYGCSLEWGGADQWGNIAAGVKLARKMSYSDGKSRNMVGATNPLLLTPEGKKMGKTEKGAIWINKDKISAYDFYQGIYQTPDACVEMMFALFTDEPMEKVRSLIKEDIVKAKKLLCFEVTKFVRGEEDAIKARQMSENLFTEGGDDAPTFELAREELADGKPICDLLFETKLAPSKSEARRLIQGGAITLKGQKVSDFTIKITENDFENGSILLKKGKKNFIKVVLK